MQIFINIVSILIFIFMLACIFFLRKKGLLQDSSTAVSKPYSFSRVQITWWTVIIIGSFLYIFAYNYSQNHYITLKILNPTALILLGISAGTLGVGRIIDAGQENKDEIRHQNSASEGFLIDIISDENGVSIHRFQCLIFNLIFGLVFILYVLSEFKMHDFSEMELTLMGISSGTYIGLKATENTTTKKAEG